MPKKKLMIFPCNGNAMEAIDCIDFEEYEFLGYIDDDPEKKSLGFDVYSRAILDKYKELFILAVPGSPVSFRERSFVIDSLKISYDRYITLIHSKAIIGKNVKIGHNCLIMAGAVITGNAILNDHVIVLPNTVIHHDVVIGYYTLIGTNVVVAGHTTIGNNCYIGSGSNIINGINVGNLSIVGLGSNLIESIPEKSKVAGNPARTLVNNNH